jgi:predicted extracellular nuclease
MSKYLLYLLALVLPFNLIAQIEEEDDLKEVSSDSARPALHSADDELVKLKMADFDDRSREGRGIRACFYNVENLFDTEDDPLKNDDDFLPKGNYGWTEYRYQQKLNNIYKTLSAVGGWGGPPEIIGFCEIENRKVLKDLISKTPFQKYGYKIVHEESPDRRGIDVGFIYRPSAFQYIGHEAIAVVFPFDTAGKTRDILHVWGRVNNKDTLHVFINHWPSRRGGQAASEPRRMIAAKNVRNKIDTLFDTRADVNVLIMGDFNDHAEDRSILEGLGAKHEMDNLGDRDLYNFMYNLGKNWKLGSHKYQGHWGTLDHIIVSAALIKNRGNEKKLHAGKQGGRIFAARFLLEVDNRYMGLQPFRTYGGPKYLGGFSDHLPIYIDLLYKD